MNYLKLTLAVTAGILLAVLIALAVIEVPEYVARRQSLERMKRALYAVDCTVSTACLDKKYAQSLEMVSKSQLNVADAAHVFCSKTAATSANFERNLQLVAECESATRVRLITDLK